MVDERDERQREPGAPARRNTLEDDPTGLGNEERVTIRDVGAWVSDDPKPEIPMPPLLLESIMILLFLVLVGYTCYVLYGPMLEAMLADLLYLMRR